METNNILILIPTYFSFSVIIRSLYDLCVILKHKSYFASINEVIISSTQGGGMLRFWKVLVLVLVLKFESFFCDLLASVGLVNKNGCKGQH